MPFKNGPFDQKVAARLTKIFHLRSSLPAAEMPSVLSSASPVRRERACAFRLRRFARSSSARRAFRWSWVVEGVLLSFAVMAAGPNRSPCSIVMSERNTYHCGRPMSAQKTSRLSDRHNLRSRESCGRSPPHSGRCRSSVVEHSLGKGEVESSILSGSTIPSR